MIDLANILDQMALTRSHLLDSATSAEAWCEATDDLLQAGYSWIFNEDDSCYQLTDLDYLAIQEQDLDFTPPELRAHSLAALRREEALQAQWEALTPEEREANFRAYFAAFEAEHARDRAAGILVFGDVLDAIRDDESDFCSAMGEGYLSWYDQADAHPTTSAGLFAYLTSYESDYSHEWNLGYAVGYAMAMAENEKSFYWTSVPPLASTEG